MATYLPTPELVLSKLLRTMLNSQHYLGEVGRTVPGGRVFGAFPGEYTGISSREGIFFDDDFGLTSSAMETSSNDKN